jgi:hypothetical protein
MPRGVPEAPLEERFWRKVHKTDGCWVWTGGVVSGYGQLLKHIWGEGLAHRWAYKNCIGELLPEELVRHKCDNRLCVNPDHLDKGAAIDNVNDMLLRNDKAFNRKIPRSEFETIIALRESGLLFNDIAALYGVERHTISAICKQRRK